LALFFLKHQEKKIWSFKEELVERQFTLGGLDENQKAEYLIELASIIGQSSYKTVEGIADSLGIIWTNRLTGSISGDMFYNEGPEPFLPNIVRLTRANLYTELQDWSSLCKNLPWNLDLLHLALTWVNRKIEQNFVLQKHLHHKNIHEALFQRWKSSRQEVARGARVATELILLSRQIIPKSGFAETIEEDFIHRLKRSKKPKHRGFILANQAELKYLMGHHEEADKLLAEAVSEGQSDIDCLGFLSRLTARFQGTLAALPLLEKLITTSSSFIYDKLPKETTWWLFRLRLLEHAKEQPGIPWDELIKKFTLLTQVSGTHINDLKQKMSIYTMLFSVTAGRFIPLL
jgi:hypothetical protein